jgi:hypothetical protein
MVSRRRLLSSPLLVFSWNSHRTFRVNAFEASPLQRIEARHKVALDMGGRTF